MSAKKLIYYVESGAFDSAVDRWAKRLDKAIPYALCYCAGFFSYAILRLLGGM